MAYRRPGRPTFYAQLRQRHGWKQVSLGTGDRSTANKIEAMWEQLAGDYRAWDVLEHVTVGDLALGTLFDLWRDAGRNLEELRRRLADVDLEPMVSDFLAVHAPKVRPDSLDHITFHLRTLLPEGQPFPRSRANVEYLTQRLYAYRVGDRAASSGTIRKVHSDWSVFFAYCADVRGLFERNPMEKVSRPPAKRPFVRFYELDTVERIVGAQPNEDRRALFAFLYGTGVEITVALSLTRNDLDEQTREVRAAGTKTHTRDRMVRIADWAWPFVWEIAIAKLPNARLFPSHWSRHTASDWHAETVKALGLTPAHPMKNARHHWAVRMLRSGTPIAVVQQQLGHATAKLTLDTYGLFIPSGHDRAKWETAATNYDTERREAR